LGRLVAVSFRPYRTHQLELHDAGGTACRVIIHPPGGRGAPQEVVPAKSPATLGDLIAQAKAIVDAVMGPRPPAPTRPMRPPREWQG
jgi:hypothetical protein